MSERLEAMLSCTAPRNGPTFRGVHLLGDLDVSVGLYLFPHRLDPSLHNGVNERSITVVRSQIHLDEPGQRGTVCLRATQ